MPSNRAFFLNFSAVWDDVDIRLTFALRFYRDGVALFHSRIMNVLLLGMARALHIVI